MTISKIILPVIMLLSALCVNAKILSGVQAYIQ